MRGSAQRRALASFEQTTRSSHGANMRMRPRDFARLAAITDDQLLAAAAAADGQTEIRILGEC